MASNSLKSELFGQVAREYFSVTAADCLVDFHKLNGGITRRDKFLWLTRNFAPEKSWEGDQKSLTEELCNLFGDRFQAQLRHLPLIPGVKIFLESLPRDSKKYIVTGGDTNETLEILTLNGMLQFFDGVYGGPISKTENMLTVAGLRENFAQRAIAFGDSELDFELAEKHDMDFVFVSGHSEWRTGHNVCSASLVDFKGSV